MNLRRQPSRVRFERMEKRELLAADLGIQWVADSPDPSADTAKIAAVDVAEVDTAEGYVQDNWFHADSFSFGVEREMKESGEKGGTEDINIGVGELQENVNPQATDVAIKSWSTSGDADDRPTEEVSFYYNKIAAAYALTPDGLVDVADYTIWRAN